jgi:hypothetical protein
MANEKLLARLEELRAEFAKGERTLSDLETQTANVRATLLRISGAIQVLEELSQADRGEVAAVEDSFVQNGHAPMVAAL